MDSQILTFHIITYGCTYNTADSDKMKTQLINHGYREENFETAKILIVNTCAVKSSTEQKILSSLRIYSEILRKKYLSSFNSDEDSIGEKQTNNFEYLIVAGCLPLISDSMLQTVVEILPERSGILSVKSIGGITNLMQRLLNGEQKVIIMEGEPDDKSQITPYVHDHQYVSTVQIAEGCSGNCAYCCTKNARGKLCSFSVESITTDIVKLLSKGIKEINLTAQDLGAFNYHDQKLHHLLDSILTIKEHFYLRLGMTNPEYFKRNTEEFMKRLSDPRIYRFIHIPVQAGSDSVLKSMNRKYEIKDFLKTVEVLRGYNQNITISTDIICGFPGESEEDWNATLDLITKVQPRVLNISKFTLRPSTDAKNMPQVNSKEIKKRSSQLTEIFEQYSEQNAKQFIGKEFDVFVSEKNPGLEHEYTARNIYYQPILLKDVELGKEYTIRITESKIHYFIGEII